MTATKSETSGGQTEFQVNLKLGLTPPACDPTGFGALRSRRCDDAGRRTYQDDAFLGREQTGIRPRCAKCPFLVSEFGGMNKGTPDLLGVRYNINDWSGGQSVTDSTKGRRARRWTILISI